MLNTTGHAFPNARTNSQLDKEALEFATQCDPSNWMGLLVMSTQSVCASSRQELPELEELQ